MADDYRRLLLQLLPQGMAWPRASDSTLARFLDAVAVEFSRVDQRAGALFAEVLPATTSELLEEWERVAGLPDPCVADQPQTLQSRRAALVARLAGTGGQSIDYFIGLAADLGYTITIEEFRPFRVGAAVVGDSLTNGDWAHTWRINGPEVTVTAFRVGQSVVGEPLRAWGNELLECRISGLKPAHTVLLFAYPEMFDPMNLFANGEQGGFYDPANEGALYADYPGTTTLITDENASIANMHDLSGNGNHGARFSAALRPKLTLLLGSYRRGVDFDGIDDAINLPFPNLGNNVTIGRARPGIGAIITGGRTIAGPINDNTDHCGLVVVDRALTSKELEGLRTWLKQRSGMADTLSVAYGDDPDEILDVFHSSGHPMRPIIFMVHGGGWRTGSKASPNVTRNKLQHWLPRGYTFVSINYPMAVGTDPIDEAHSVAKALAWVQSQALAWGCNPDNIVVMGHSAGGHLVTLMAANAGIQAAHNVAPWLGTVVIDGAGYNIVSIMQNPGHLELYDEPWGAAMQHWIDGSPTHQLTVAPRPMLLITSTDSNPDEADPNVGPFRDAVHAIGGIATILQTDLAHSETNSEMGKLGAYSDAVDAFLASLGL